MNRLQFTFMIVCFLFANACPNMAMADILLPSVGVTVTESYNDFRGLGFAPGASPASGQLDSNSYRVTGFSDGDGVFGGTHTTGNFARGTTTGGVTTSGIYGIELSPSDFAVGVQPTDSDFTPGVSTFRVSNQTGAAIPGVNIAAEGWSLNDEDRSTRWTFSVSTDDTTYFDFAIFDSDEAADVNPVWEVTALGGFIPFVSPLANGGQFFIRIIGDDLAGTGSRDEFALDDLSITAVPEPSTTALIALIGVTLAGTRRRHYST